ncbi:MAG: hypothetical protein A2096_00960 [Spirochaetes bacterium GWF1_41_5]|nr:MAG: hypothetical protein A2096_00960 [Spirochaetes bacterium GWF1_41_5]
MNTYQIVTQTMNRGKTPGVVYPEAADIRLLRISLIILFLAFMLHCNLCADNPTLQNNPELKAFDLVNANGCEARISGGKEIGSGEIITITIPDGRKPPADNKSLVNSLALLQQSAKTDIRTGDTIKISFWARARPENIIYLRLWTYPREKQNKWGILHEFNTKVTDEWKEFAVVRDVALETVENGKIDIIFGFGHQAGDVELKNIRLLNYGKNPEPYPTVAVDWFGGTPNPDTWRVAAEKRIEEIRMGILNVQITDKSGNPAIGSQISIRQLGHAFNFGAAVIPEYLIGPDAVPYSNELKKHFNSITPANDLKWNRKNPDAVNPAAVQLLQWIKENGFSGAYGHTLYWPKTQFTPPKYRDKSESEFRDAVRKHVRQYAREFKGAVDVWDVINEVKSSDKPELMCGKNSEFLIEVFKIAREEDSGALLSYNENEILRWDNGLSDPGREKFLRIVRELREGGAPINLIGIQSHIWQPLTPIGKVIEILDEVYAKTGLQVHITEFTAECSDDDLHGVYCSDFLTAAFSHPAVRGFTLWSFWGGETNSRYVQNKAEYIRRDWTYRPAMTQYDQLVFGKWWSRKSGVSGADGTFRTRVFLGAYEIQATGEGKTAVQTVHVSAGKDTLVRLQLQ